LFDSSNITQSPGLIKELLSESAETEDAEEVFPGWSPY